MDKADEQFCSIYGMQFSDENPKWVFHHDVVDSSKRVWNPTEHALFGAPTTIPRSSCRQIHHVVDLL